MKKLGSIGARLNKYLDSIGEPQLQVLETLRINEPDDLLALAECYRNDARFRAQGQTAGEQRRIIDLAELHVWTCIAYWLREKGHEVPEGIEYPALPMPPLSWTQRMRPVVVPFRRP